MAADDRKNDATVRHFGVGTFAVWAKGVTTTTQTCGRRPRLVAGAPLRLRFLALALATLAPTLTGCSLSGPFFDDSYEKAKTLSPEPVPPYRRLVATAMKGFKSPIEPAGLQISEPRWIERVGGPAWIVCLKSDPQASVPVYYAFFIQKQAVVDTRTAVGTDRCVHQEFAPFDAAVH